MLFNIYMGIAVGVIAVLSIFIILRTFSYETRLHKQKEQIKELEKGLLPQGVTQEGQTMGKPSSVVLTSVDRDDLLRRMLYAANKPDPYAAAKGIVDILLQYGGFNLDNASLFLYNKKRGTMRLLYSNIGNQYEKSVQSYVNVLNKQVMQKGKRGYTAYTDAGGTLNYDTAAKRQIKYMFYIPIYRGNNLLGSLMVESRDSECHKTLSLQFFKLVVENISLVLSNIILMKQIITSSHTDALSGAYTRKHLGYFVKPFTKTGVQLTLVMTDIDKFKGVNDTYGHLTGDVVIKTVVKYLQSMVRDEEDGVFRYGGEEFLIVFSGMTQETVLKRLEEIRGKLERTKVISEDGREFHITISMGVAKYDAIKGLQGSISAADKALYYSKEHGRNRITLYEDIDDSENDLSKIETERM